MKKLICKQCNKEIKNPCMWGSGIVSGFPIVVNGKIVPKEIYCDPDDYGFECEHCGSNIPSEATSNEMKTLMSDTYNID